MSFWRFLKYERPYLLLCAAVFLLTAAVFATDAQASWSWQTFFYAASLAALVLAAFLAHRYLKSIQASRLSRLDETEPLSLEAEAYREALETMRIEHIRGLNEVQAKQKEYYDFILSWFHEIKTPISVIRLMQQTEIEPRSLEEEVS
ncbi:hypothetical protein [Paenibacillus kobensis]|uniref:hypothetical protein n=1 Tax=Paenibacillus kobensis TaxID=59841 RepID=UPI001FEC0642|nr:hypothetical protein [Paenibacillus kobensis]